MYAAGTLGLGQYDTGLEETLSSEGPARAYIREKWGEFLNLGPRIVDLQHRAALAAGAARERGDTQSYELARGVIAKLGELNVAMGKAIDTFNLEGIGAAVGLSGYRGLGAVPVIAAFVFSSVALVVLWAFRSFEAESRKLDLIEQGILTPAEAAALDPGPAPGAFLAGIGDIGKLVLWGAIAWFAFQIATQYAPKRRGQSRSRSNPPLEVWHTNPPGLIGDDVYDVRYQHADDGLDYVHDFGPNVELEALPDGSVLLSHRDGLPLWDDFEMEND